VPDIWHAAGTSCRKGAEDEQAGVRQSEEAAGEVPSDRNMLRAMADVTVRFLRRKGLEAEALAFAEAQFRTGDQTILQGSRFEKWAAVTHGAVQDFRRKRLLYELAEHERQGMPGRDLEH